MKIVSQMIIFFWLGFPFLVQADLRYYSAPIDESSWLMSQSSPIICQLSHKIPELGTAHFTSRASKKMNMVFELDMLVEPNRPIQVALISRAPPWRPGIVDQPLLNLTFERYQDVQIQKTIAWSMLAKLEQGMEPTFFYTDWHNKTDKVAVGLSPANFDGEFLLFKQCMNRLLDYNLRDYSWTVFYYEYGNKMTHESQQDLDRLSEYLLYDNEFTRVTIDSYTDSYGGPTQNRKIAQRRASSMKKFFTDRGVPRSRIITRSHPMKRYAAKNNLSTERANNRRVVIRILKHDD